MATILKKKRSKGVSKSVKAGIIFPVSRINRYLRKLLKKYRFAMGASIYLASVMEYLTAEIMELAGNAARDNKKHRVNPRHILLAIMNDEELNQMLKDVIIPSGGVLPKILPELLPVKKDSELQKSFVPVTYIRKDYVTNSSTRRRSSEIKARMIKNKSLEKKHYPNHKVTLEKSNIDDIKCDAVIIPLKLNDEFTIKIKDKGIESQVKLLNKEMPLEIGECKILESQGSTKANKIIVCYNVGEVAALTPNVIHDKGSMLKLLETTILNCLSLANTKKVNSIAIPSNVVNFKSFKDYKTAGDSVSLTEYGEAIFSSVSKFYDSTPTSTIKQIYLVGKNNEQMMCYANIYSKMGD